MSHKDISKYKPKEKTKKKIQIQNGRAEIQYSLSFRAEFTMTMDFCDIQICPSLTALWNIPSPPTAVQITGNWPITLSPVHGAACVRGGAGGRTSLTSSEWLRYVDPGGAAAPTSRVGMSCRESGPSLCRPPTV